MVIFLYSDKKYERQAISCIKSLTNKLTDDIKIVYYTIGFKSDFEFPNLHKVEYPINPHHSRFNFYKAELSLVTMDMFPNEDYIFTDTDVLFSARFNPKKLKHTLTYPMASYGPYEYPFYWKSSGDNKIIHDEKKMMQYFNVPERSQRYVWSCFYVFNSECRDFFEEYTSICTNKYLNKYGVEYFPYADETAFNVCLWKRDAKQNLGFVFVNSQRLSTVQAVEQNLVNNTRMGNETDSFGADWEHIDNPENIILYHGFKDEDNMSEVLNYLLDIPSQPINKEYSGMQNELLHHYKTTKILNRPPIRKLNMNCVGGMFVEVTSGPDTRYNVKFINNKTGMVSYETEIGKNCWARSSSKYYVDWRVELTDTQTNKTEIYNLDLRGKRVYISFESRSLGDTLAWIPYVEEFRKKHGCEIICSTFWNHMFISEYTDITFINPGDTVYNLTAMYSIGLFYKENGTINYSLHPSDPLKVPLQRLAADILGIDYVEIRPRLVGMNREVTKMKQVAIAIHSTAQAKYWNNPTGWQDVVDWLLERGYKVKLLSKEGDDYMGNKIPKGVVHHPAGIETAIEELRKSELFIGLGSGLSWLSWATNTPTMVISGFSYKWAEVQDCIRIGAPAGKCEGCFNRHRLDAGDWNWCPDHKDTPRQFECTKSITSDVVIRELEKFFDKKKPRIQIKHLLTRPNDERERRSVDSIKQLQKYGMDYQQMINEVYEDIPPSENCGRPDHISKDNKPGELYPGAGLGWITGRHYGCYLAHRGALESIDSANFDYTLVFEADAYISTNLDDFIKIVEDACDISERDDVYYISFANNFSWGEPHKVDEQFIRTSNHQDLAHCYLIPNRHKDWWMERIKDCKWDVTDLWYNDVFKQHPQLRYTTNKVYSKQGDGYSLLDESPKTWV